MEESFLEKISEFKEELLSADDFQLVPTNIAYQVLYHKDIYRNHSFVVSVDGKAALLVLCSSKDSHLTWLGEEIKFVYKNFLSDEQRYKAHILAGKKLEETVNDFSIEKMLVSSDFSIERVLGFSFDKALIFGRDYILTSLDYTEIKSNLRKSFKSLINWGEKNLKTVIFDKSNVTEKDFDEFRLFHLRVAGRETRSRETWFEQMKAISLDEAFLVCCYLDENLVSAQYVHYGKKIAYYGVGVMDRELMSKNVPLGHWPMIVSIKRLNSLGVKKLILNNVLLDADHSDKEDNISKFKKGFTKLLDYKTIINLKKIKNAE